MRKICVVVTNRSDYGRLKPIMVALKARPDVALQVVIGAHVYTASIISHIRHAEPASLRKSLPWYIRARITALFGGRGRAHQLEQLGQAVARDGFTISAQLPLLLEGGTVSAMTKSTGFGLLNLPEIFEELKPDIALINGDRFEIFSVAIASAFMNIPLAHIEGGDVSGTIDNSIRHAITKLAHIHFPATKESERRIICMGEDARMVFTYGSPTIDMVKGIDTTLDNSLFDRYPTHVGSIDLTKPYMLIAHHPVTTEHKDNYRQMKELLAAIDVVGMPQFFVSTNIDAGSDGIARAMREYRAGPGAARSVFHKHVSLEDYTKLLAHATVAVGNSSSFLREAGYFGTPAVIVGTRQQFRERGENVIEVTSQTEKIVEALQQQLRHGKYPSDLRFGDGTASSKIAEKLATIDLKEVSVQKYFCEQK
jgi:UDP-hydrolysing UDP-N-acetyl-D-glucosamine 2-epimerase